MFRSVLFVGLAVTLASCGEASGVGGAPVSLAQHAELVCNKSWDEFENQIAQAKGQEKDLLLQHKKSISQQEICLCSKEISAMGELKYDTRGEAGVAQELLVFNSALLHKVGPPGC